MQAANLFVAKLNNPVIFIDPTGLAVWFVHGTWARQRDTKFTDETMELVAGHFGQRHFDYYWSGRNSRHCRRDARDMYVDYIVAWHNENPHDPIRLVGHSHGGNVAIMVANSLAEYGIRVETLITIATPVRSDFQLNQGVNVGQHINIYNLSDAIQINGGRIVHTGLSGRTFSGAENIQIVATPRTGPLGIWNRPFYSHEFMHNNTQIWRDSILPAVRFCRERDLNEWGLPLW